jgi:bifunctional DNA-binding transcriptional regulator/antitoxin component of YhaV-PrlF toxin-antitoxin module
VIPVEVRRLMNLAPGDVIHFGVRPGTSRVEIFTAQLLIDQMWANNTGADAADSTDAVRQLRQEDQVLQEESEARISADAGDAWDEATETARLLAALSLG